MPTKKRVCRALTRLEWTDPDNLDDQGVPRTVVVPAGATFDEADFPERGNLAELVKHKSVELVD